MVLPAGLAQPAVAAPAGRQTNSPKGRIDLELVAAFKKQSLLPPWIDSSCLWSDSTKACMQFTGRRRLCRRELVVATAGGRSRVVRGVPITACLCDGGVALAAWRRRRVDLFFFPVAAGTSLFLAS